MRAVRPIALSFAVAITTSLIAAEPLQYALASDAVGHRLNSFEIAQTSMGSPDPMPPPAPSPLPAPAPSPSTPRMDYIPPSFAPTPAPPSQPSTSTELPWGAIGFTADGSYSSNWKMPSRPEAEAKAAKGCAQFGRGGCQVVSFSGQECVALATFIGSYRRRRWNLSFTAGGTTYPEAQNAAMARCNADERSQGRCQPRTAACADGR
ncbi:MAG: DUF4189 domain-containing protein [Bradyrhizobium sp.]